MKRILSATLVLSLLWINSSDAAIAPTTIFETNPSATSGNVNGGGFNPANTHGPTDGVISNGTTSSPTLSSVTYSFNAGDVGAWVYFPTQTNMVNSYAQIASVAGGVATLTAGAGTLNIPSAAAWGTNVSSGVATTASPTGVTFLVDYSRQTSAIQNFTNLGSTNGSTTLTDSSSGNHFTPVMVGNLIGISAGTNATVSWYEIVSYTDANNVVLDRTPHGANTMSATTGNVGGSISLGSSTSGITDSNFFSQGSGTSSAAPHFFISTGSYTLQNTTVNILSVASGWDVIVEGYNAIRGDRPTNSSRPTLNMGNAGILTTQGSNILTNLQITGSSSTVVNINGASSIVQQCYILNTSTTAARIALSVNFNGELLYRNEIVSENGYAVKLTVNGYFIQILNNYIHDSSYGVYDQSANAGQNQFIGNLIVANTSYGIYLAVQAIYGEMLLGNTFFGASNNLGTAISSPITQTYDAYLYDNIFSGFVTGVSNLSQSNGLISNYNDYYNNTSDVNNAYKGVGDIAVNPSFTSVSQVTGTSASTSSTTLTDGGKNFTTAGVVAGRDYVYCTAGCTGEFGITAVGTTTLTLDNAAGTHSGNVNYQITIGRNFASSGLASTTGYPGAFPAGYTTGHLSIGAAQPLGGGGTVGYAWTK